MPNYRRDGLLATTALAVLLGVLLLEGTTEMLWRPIPAVAGVLGALVIEFGFLRYRSVPRWWDHSAVQFGGLVAVLVSGMVGYITVGAPVVVALCWGLVTYFLLLGAVLTVGHNPLAVIER
jgi:hypothetical protein